ncbi:MAG: FAD-dependent oxidoreductase [Actinobacteria bacterium]|nr:FAD-dependent oxidoreductase [Actinomycetota bacterium]
MSDRTPVWWAMVDRPKLSSSTTHSLGQMWDVVIIGAGFSGLWTAHHLIKGNPHLKIAILEKNLVGSGASGRNGGWVSALYPAPDETLLRKSNTVAVKNLHHQLRNSIDEIGTFAAENNIDCGFHKGGTLVIATNVGQERRLREHMSDEEVILDAQQTRARINMNGSRISMFSPHCAAINPAALVVGLAASLEKKGVVIFENTAADLSSDKRVWAKGVELKAGAVVRAMEAYHSGTRDQIPIYSLMIATEPLPLEVFDEIGINNRETFADASFLINYAQRTADNRLAIGGRGAPYVLGSRRKDSRENFQQIHKKLESMARQWFPILDHHTFTHHWGGAVGVTRDWAPYLRWDGRYAELGGYVGDGVTLSYLVAAATADLICGNTTVRTTLPFVGWTNPLWELEPARFLAINSAIALSSVADAEEKWTGKPSLVMKALSPIIGK